MREKNEKIFWDMEMIGNRRKKLEKILVSGEISRDLNATTPVVNYDHDIIKERKVWGADQ